MKIPVILFLALILTSCNATNQSAKKFYQDRSRISNISYDSILKRLYEFSANSKAPSKIIGVEPGIVLMEETFNEKETYIYTDYDPQKQNTNVLATHERLLINITKDSAKTAHIEIKSFLTCSISFIEYEGKALNRVKKEINCNSTGVRENEILDFICSNN
jgi:hypothetical protein